MNKPITAITASRTPRCGTYLGAGERRAFSLGNRGPIRFTADGAVHPDILDAYWRCGFYVFENVLRPQRTRRYRGRHPRHPGPPAGREGRAARRARTACAGGRHKAPSLFWSKPLGDPFGGTSLAGGRHPVKMFEPTGGRGRAERGRVPDPGFAAVLRRGLAGLWPSPAAGRRRGGERRRFRAVQ